MTLTGESNLPSFQPCSDKEHTQKSSCGVLKFDILPHTACRQFPYIGNLQQNDQILSFVGFISLRCGGQSASERLPSLRFQKSTLKVCEKNVCFFFRWYHITGWLGGWNMSLNIDHPCLTLTDILWMSRQKEIRWWKASWGSRVE